MKFILNFNLRPSLILNILRVLNICLFLVFVIQADTPRRKNQVGVVWVNEPTKDLPVGVTHKTYKSLLVEKNIGYCIYLPPSYSLETERRYPVIYNLHGNGGNELRTIDSAALLHEGILDGRWPEMIMVFPNGGHSTFYKDSYDGRFPMESIFIKEFIPMIDKAYRTVAKREGRCIEGFSMGGRGAVRLAMKYPEMFCSLFCQAGNVPRTAEDFDLKEKSEHPNSYLGPNKQNYIDNDPFLLLKKNLKKIKGKMRIMIACGTKDYGHMPTVREFHQALLDSKVDHTYLEIEGLAHQRTKMMGMMSQTWFDYHVDSLKKTKVLK